MQHNHLEFWHLQFGKTQFRRISPQPRVLAHCRQIVRCLVSAALLGLCAVTGAGAVEPGDVGYGLTVMKGTQIDTFAVEIIGRQAGGALPGRDRILVRLSGLDLERTGIVRGMSGSPVYIGGKLVGAVAYGWSFANEPVGMLTPIEDMLEVMARDLTGPDERTPSGQGWRLSAPLWVSGAGAATLDLLSELLSDFQTVASPSGTTAAAATTGPLQPGSAVGLRLIGGDMTIAAIGTVTHVEDNRIVAFGHDFVGSGGIDLPMTQAHIHGVLANESASFKLGAATQVVGAARQDRFAGVAGVIGASAKTLPLAIQVHSGSVSRSFHFEVARHRFYTTSLAQIALMGALESSTKALGEASVRLRLQIDLKDGRSVDWRRVYTGLNAPMSAALETGRPVQTLLQSGFSDIDIAGLEARVWVDEKVHVAHIESARLDRAVMTAGTVATVAVRLRPHDGASRQLLLPLQIPAGIAGPVQLHISNGRDAALRSQERWDREPPGSSEALLRLLSMPALDDELVVELTTDAEDIAVGGRELPTPPPSVQRLLLETPSTGSVRSTSSRVLSRQEIRTDFVLQGEHVLMATVEPKGNQ